MFKTISQSNKKCIAVNQRKSNNKDENKGKLIDITEKQNRSFIKGAEKVMSFYYLFLKNILW